MPTTRSPGRASVGSIGHLEPDRSSLQTASLPLRTHSGHVRQAVKRRKRKMTPADKKDATYWIKREKNNEAARRSREKRRLQDLLVKGHLLTLTKENAHLRAQVLTLQYNRSLCASTGKVTFAQEAATSTAGVLSHNFSIPPVQTDNPTLLQPRPWGNNTCLLGARHESALPRVDIPWLGNFNATLHGLSVPRVISAPDLFGGSPKARMDVQNLLSNRENTRTMTAAPAHLLPPTPGFRFPRPVSGLHRPSNHWLLSQPGYPSRASDLTLRPSPLPPPVMYPALPLQLPEIRHQGLEAQVEMEGKSRFSGAPARVYDVGLHSGP